MELVAAHLGAATLSMMAMMANEAVVFIMARLVMPPLGFFIAWHAWNADDPAWIVAGLFLSGAIFLPFFTPGRPGWIILNPIVAVAYLAHLGWMAFAA